MPRQSPEGDWQSTGGWFFAANPELSPTHIPAIWDPSAAAIVVQLRHGGIADGGFNTLTITENASIVARHSDDMATHMVLACEGRRYRLIIIGDLASTAPLSFMLPVDHFWDVRRAAMSAFQEHVHLGVRRPRPACLVPGHSERWRLVQWLRMLDALPEGVSARELAVDLIARDAGRYSSAEWDSSSERKRIARWQRNALAVRDGGYLRLLNGR